jgi:hypothetical protein
MKNIVLILFLGVLIFPQSTQAQISMEQDTFIALDQDYKADWIEFKFHVINNSSSGDTMFYWKRVVNDPCGFPSAICDLNLCYPESYDSAAFNMPIGLDTIFVVYFYPGNVSFSCCDLQLYLVSQTNPGNSDSAYFQACTKASILTPKFETVKLFPNPATNQIKLETHMHKAYTVEVYDLSGKLVFSKDAVYDHQSLDLSALEPGAYYLKALGERTFAGSFLKQ